ARAKFTRAGAMFFTRDGLEQATAEPLARHRAARYARFGRRTPAGAARIADLCCGIGGDLLALAGVAAEVRAADRDPAQVRMPELTPRACGAPQAVTPSRPDAGDVARPGVDAVFAAPARRAGGRRLRSGEGEPPLDWCLALARRVEAVGIKAAPGL